MKDQVDYLVTRGVAAARLDSSLDTAEARQIYADLHAGREVRAPDIDFSGLEYVFGPGFQGADYQVAVSKAR